MATEHEFSLLDNALDYVLSAAEHAAKSEPRNLKYSVLHLFAGVELLLKARLQREHWTLLFMDVEKASPRRLLSGDFKSVDFDSALARLEAIADVKIDSDSRSVLNQLRVHRNKIQHFGAKFSVEAVRAQIADAANFVVDFVKEQLEDTPGSHAEQVQAIRRMLQENREFVSARMGSLEAELTGKQIVDCPECSQDAIVLADGEPLACRFCDYKTSADALAEQRSETREVLECPHCDTEACAFMCGTDECWYKCFSCGEEMRGDKWDVCTVCNSKLIDDGGICVQCLQDKVADDRS